MTWFPIGPDFVFAPKNRHFKRLTRQNEYGRQGLAKCIEVDQVDPSVIYTVDRPSSGGTAAFRTLDGGGSWKAISDSLPISDPLIDPHWIAINPSHRNTIYMASYHDQGLYISNDRGDSWGAKKSIPGKVRKLIVDSRTASTLATTHLIAAGPDGVYFSDNAGDSWSQVVTGDVFSITAHIPASGTANFYAGVKAKGVFHANDASGTWTNLNDASIGLPQFVAGDGITQEDNFHHILVDVCHHNSSRVYAWLAKPKGPSNGGPYITEGIYTTSNPAGSWQKLTFNETTLSAAIAKDEHNYQNATPASMTGIERGVVLTIDEGGNEERVLVVDTTATTFKGCFKKDHAAGVKIQANPPDPAQGWYNYVFAVAPNSPGSGTGDVLFFGRIELFRSINGGKTWVREGIGFHADQHAFEFFPRKPASGVIPVAYIGCDGGISRSTKYCDPGFDIAGTSEKYGADLQYQDIGTHENLDHGRQASALYQYASHSDMNAMGYIGCQDTGVNGGPKVFGWQGLADADAGAIAIAPGDDGVKVWGIMGAYSGFPSFRISLWTDKGDYAPAQSFVKLDGTSGPLINGTSNYEISPNDECLAGAFVRDPQTTLTAAVTGSNTAQSAAPGSMTGIKTGAVLTIGEGNGAENVAVTSVTATTFTAVIKKDHASGTKVWVNRTFAAKIDKNGIARQISQDFGLADNDKPKVKVIAPHPVDANVIVCATNDEKIWLTNSGAGATSATVWTEVAGNKPTGITIHAIAISPNKDTYVFLRQPVSVSNGSGAMITTPLFKLSSGDWVPQACSGNPAATAKSFYGKLVAHPKRNDTLFASHASRVFKLKLIEGEWSWTDISSGLPGQYVYDLWIGYLAAAKKEEHVILRVGVPTRGVWEKVVAEDGQEPSSTPYLFLRDHLLDQGLLGQSEDGVKDPYTPTRRLWHYQSADIKVDTRNPGSATAPPFYQTDPEGGTPPFSHVIFNQLRDNSQSLEAGSMAWVHVQAQNRSYTKADNVRVWAIYCNASAGVPSLSKSPSQSNNFDFWNQFKLTGEIIPQLPADSPWKSVGAPVTLNQIDVYSPRVASWNWATPTLATGDPGHYCMVAFVHSATNPVNKSSLDVDFLTPRSRQMGQKNLHIGPPLAPDGSGGGGGTPPSPVPGGPSPRMNEYVEFHNADPEPRAADLLFDFSHLPPELKVTLQFTNLNLQGQIEDVIEGIDHIRRPEKDEEIAAGGEPWWRRFVLFLFNFLCALLNWLRKWAGLDPIDCFVRPKVPMPNFRSLVFEAAPGSQVIVPNVFFDGHGMEAAFIRVRNTGKLDEGSEYHFEVQQLVSGVAIGGSTYLVRIAGDRKLPPPNLFPFVMEEDDPRDWDRIEKEAQDLKYLPPWATDIVREREEEDEK